MSRWRWEIYVDIRSNSTTTSSHRHWKHAGPITFVTVNHSPAAKSSCPEFFLSVPRSNPSRSSLLGPGSVQYLFEEVRVKHMNLSELRAAPSDRYLRYHSVLSFPSLVASIELFPYEASS